MGVNLRFLGALLELIGILLLFYFFITLPPFSEFEWESKMEHVIVMDQGGICLYDEALNEGSELIDQNLVAGAISSINILLEEITSDKGIIVINKKCKSIIIYPGKKIYGIMFCTEELNYIKVLLKRFIGKFEAVYILIILIRKDSTGNFLPDGSTALPLGNLAIINFPTPQYNNWTIGRNRRFLPLRK